MRPGLGTGTSAHTAPTDRSTLASHRATLAATRNAGSSDVDVDLLRQQVHLADFGQSTGKIGVCGCWLAVERTTLGPRSYLYRPWPRARSRGDLPLTGRVAPSRPSAPFAGCIGKVDPINTLPGVVAPRGLFF